MNRVAIAFSTKDRVELTKRSIEPLLQPDKFDLWWVDGSKTDEGKKLHGFYANDKAIKGKAYGGSGPAIVYALTRLLQSGSRKDITLNVGAVWDYDYIGLVENDVLLHDGWFDDMMALFERGKQDGFEVGAVSARCYEDRILIQRDGYAICHNLGAGMIMFTRKAAELVLQNYRTVWTTENRLLFAQLSGIDIGGYWAFRGSEHFLVADWNFDRVLAANGLASLALTPNRVTMLDQDIGPLGLKYADGKFLRPGLNYTGDDVKDLYVYRDSLARIRSGEMKAGVHEPFFRDAQGYTIFPHQIPQIGGTYTGDWRIRDFLGFGPFCWKAGENIETDGFYMTESGGMISDDIAHDENPDNWNRPKANIPVSGPCDIIVSGGKDGGKFKIEDEQSGYNAEPFLPPEDGNNFMMISIPSGAAYRNIKITALSPGVCFMGLKTREPQPWLPHVKFDYSTLPPA